MSNLCPTTIAASHSNYQNYRLLNSRANLKHARFQLCRHHSVLITCDVLSAGSLIHCTDCVQGHQIISIVEHPLEIVPC